MRLWTVQNVDVLKSVIANGKHYNDYVDGWSKTKEKDKKYVDISKHAPIYAFATIHNDSTDYLGINAMGGGFYGIAEKLNLGIMRGDVMIELEVPDSSDDIISIQTVFDSVNGGTDVYCSGAGSIDMAITFFGSIAPEESLEVVLTCLRKEWLVGYYEFVGVGVDCMIVYPRKLDCKYGNTMTINCELNVCSSGYLVSDEGYAIGESMQKSIQDTYGLGVLYSRMTIREINQVCASNICFGEIGLLLDSLSVNDDATVNEILLNNKNIDSEPMNKLRDITVDWY